jgi:MFS transporter, PAT family, beta-lactamase induction signal transducer AmpG
MSENKPSYKNPFLWVPSSYLAMGLIYATVTSASTIMFSNLGMDNATVTFWSSLFILPYTIKPLWAPVVELYKTKKFFVLTMQFLLVISLILAAFTLQLPGNAYLIPMLIMLWIIAFAGATQDIASDGVYVTTLEPAKQAKYLGIQSMCWQIGPILATGILVRASGMLHTTPDKWESSWLVDNILGPVINPIVQMANTSGDWHKSWMIVLFTIAGLIALMAIYHTKILPPGEKAKDAPKSVADGLRTFGHAFVTFFQKKDIVLMILFAFFFRFGYAFLERVAPLFMIAKRDEGGLGLTNIALGDINGTFGTIAFMVGSILGGLFVAKLGLRKTLLILCLCMNVPNVVFVYFSQMQPEAYWIIATGVTIEKFFWGFGAVGLMIYMMQQMAPGPYRTAHYTFGTAFMALNMMITGMVSGWIQEIVGYKIFFIIVLAAAIPSIIVTILAPFHHHDSTATNTDEKLEAIP